MNRLRSYLPYLLPWWLLVPVITTMLYLVRIDAEEARQRLLVSERLESAVHFLEEAIARLLLDVRLARQTTLTHLVNDDAQGTADFFRDFMTVHPRYTQARQLDSLCRETLRFDQRPSGPIRVSEGMLQDKSGRYYCTETLKLAPDQIYLSPLDLNIENGRVVEPHEPTLRGAMRLDLPDGQLAGLVVLNFNASHILQAFSRPGETELNLLNDEGHWLASPIPGEAFGFALGAPGRSFARNHPALWRDIQRNPARSAVVENEGKHWLYRRVTAHDDSGKSVVPVWYAVALIESPAVVDKDRGVLWAHVLVGALVLLSLSLVAALFARSNLRRDTLSRQLADTNAQLTESLKHLEASLEDRVQSEKLASLGLLVAGVAHELNTPLGGAMLTGTRLQDEMIRLQAAYDAGLRQSDLTRHLEVGTEGVALLNNNLQRAARLIAQFKAVASDRSSAERARFDLKTSVDDVLALMRGETRHRHVTLTVDIPPGIMLDSYPGPLGQIVQNLVANALHHAFGPDTHGHIVITGVAQGDTIELSIRDDGCGIDPSVAPRIWDPFFTTARHRGGTGLGLHLCQQLAEHVLGGRLTLEPTAPGRGTCMRLQLPRVAPTEAETPATGR